MKELHTEVEKARSHELNMKARWEEQRSKEKKLERQIVNCVIKRPITERLSTRVDPVV